MLKANEQHEFGEELVYHYTSIDALMKIVESKAIWCTAISYLNDSSERDYVLAGVRRRLSEVAEPESLKNKIVEALSSPEEAPYARSSLSAEQFVASFSRHYDSLAHWRSYCPHQAGVAIGFRVSCLEHANVDEKPQAGMVVPGIACDEVRYLDTGNDPELDKIIERTEQITRGVLDQAGRSDDLYPRYFARIIAQEACFYKHLGFEQENEFRLLVANLMLRENNIRFRTVRSTLVPYVQMRVPTRYEIARESKYLTHGWDAIGAVVIGPSPNIELSERALSAFFNFNLIEVDVRRSDIPYRDW